MFHIFHQYKLIFVNFLFSQPFYTFYVIHVIMLLIWNILKISLTKVLGNDTDEEVESSHSLIMITSRDVSSNVPPQWCADENQVSQQAANIRSQRFVQSDQQRVQPDSDLVSPGGEVEPGHQVLQHLLAHLAGEGEDEVEWWLVTSQMVRWVVWSFVIKWEVWDLHVTVILIMLLFLFALLCQVSLHRSSLQRDTTNIVGVVK